MNQKEPFKHLLISYALLSFFQVAEFLGKVFSVHNIRVFIIKLIVSIYIILWLFSYFHSWYGTLHQFNI